MDAWSKTFELLKTADRFSPIAFLCNYFCQITPFQIEFEE